MIQHLIKNGVSGLITGVGTLIDEVHTSKEEELKAEYELHRLEHEQIQGQLEVNKQEAKHRSLFVAGWRPAVGWVCVLALLWNYLCQPMILWLTFFIGIDLTGAPKLDTAELTTILIGMLGLGGFRSWEKGRGVARSK